MSSGVHPPNSVCRCLHSLGPSPGFRFPQGGGGVLPLPGSQTRVPLGGRGVRPHRVLRSVWSCVYSIPRPLPSSWWGLQTSVVLKDFREVLVCSWPRYPTVKQARASSSSGFLVCLFSFLKSPGLVFSLVPFEPPEWPLPAVWPSRVDPSWVAPLRNLWEGPRGLKQSVASPE